jgi:hypothetical protein
MHFHCHLAVWTASSGGPVFCQWVTSRNRAYHYCFVQELNRFPCQLRGCLEVSGRRLLNWGASARGVLRPSLSHLPPISPLDKSPLLADNFLGE